MQAGSWLSNSDVLEVGGVCMYVCMFACMGFDLVRHGGQCAATARAEERKDAGSLVHGGEVGALRSEGVVGSASTTGSVEKSCGCCLLLARERGVHARLDDEAATRHSVVRDGHKVFR
mmetsp:Transcript_6083/g.12370  ORF Transcript_6083/g.12370 Transcript_6083/m.12370 type:complete len:118 (-) Transcript_6083:1007-1360(-)